MSPHGAEHAGFAPLAERGLVGPALPQLLTLPRYEGHVEVAVGHGVFVRVIAEQQPSPGHTDRELHVAPIAPGIVA